MFQCDKIEDLERQSAVSWGHVGRIAFDGHKKAS